jgi:hypothetical protein
MPDNETIHGLNSNNTCNTLCGFRHGRGGNLPAGHKWVSHLEVNHRLITCTECKSQTDKILANKPA